MQPSQEELEKYAEDHLLYEVEQLHDLTDRLLEVRAHDDAHGSRDLDYLDMATRNAQVESFAINVRVLCDFLYERPQQDDVSAGHYIEGDWNPTKLTEGLTFVKDRVNKEIAHLTLRRAQLSEEERQWKYATIWGDIATVLRAFVEAASPDLLSDAVARRIRELTASKNDLLASIGLSHASLAVTATNTIYSLPETEGMYMPGLQTPGESQPGTATHRAPPVGPGMAKYRGSVEDQDADDTA